MFLATQLDDGSAILFTVLALVITLALCYLLYRLIKRNIRLQKEENDIIVENAITKKHMIESVKQYIKKVDRFGAMTLMHIDLDGFADVNEVFGEEACDIILKEVAARMLRTLPYKASLCRFDGDKFIVFLKDEDSRERCDKLAHRLLEIISMPYQVLIGENINLTASIGIVTYPVAGSTFEELYSNLQLTTYVSKRDGGNRYTNYYASIVEEEQENMLYFREVKDAIKRKEFVLYYQPIVNLADKTLYGAEALMRWNHPTKGIQAPSTFLKVLEQTGDIKWVGEWGVESIIRMHQQLQQAHPEVPMILSLNLSTKQLLDVDLANRLIEIAKKNDAHPENYQFEISEFMMVEKINVIKTNIYKLRDFGFRIAVDGFELDGTSVQAIQRCPVDVIKLGRNFLKDYNSNFIKEKFLEILVKHAQGDNKLIISEGVETADVTKYVKDKNIMYGQGFYFARPMNADSFNEYIEKRQYKLLLDQVTMLEDVESLGVNKEEDEVEAPTTEETVVEEKVVEENTPTVEETIVTENTETAVNE